MSAILKLTGELIDVKTGHTIKKKIIVNKSLTYPTDLEQLGFSHQEQIKILQQSQDLHLSGQELEIDNHDTCPNCGRKLHYNGSTRSKFHAIFTDHCIQLKRKQCQCGWKSPSSIHGLYGTSLHPDLVEMQSLLGAEHSFQKSAEILARKCQAKRPVNNDDRIKKTICQAGNILQTIKTSSSWCESKTPCAELVLQIDGGHLKPNVLDKRSFEALIATVYSAAEGVKTNRVCVASANDDRLRTIKQLTLNACLKAGMNHEITTLVALSDGASNCWSVIQALRAHCKQLIPMLDWFHIGMNFKNRESCIPEHLRKKFDKVKWHCWHGKPATAIARLKQIQAELIEQKSIKKINELMNYIKTNQEYIICYRKREKAGLPFTSQLAESTVENIINARQAQTRKMQWSREGANAILQIRTSIKSNQWETDWNRAKQVMFKKAA